jgi:hypothetical protein
MNIINKRNVSINALIEVLEKKEKRKVSMNISRSVKILVENKNVNKKWLVIEYVNRSVKKCLVVEHNSRNVSRNVSRNI